MMKPDRELAASIYKEFKARPHSQHIASEFALYHLANLLSTHKFRYVLEIGAGIGTITKLLLVHPRRPQRILSTENHPICLSELEKNLSGVDNKGWSVVDDCDDIDPLEAFDLVIFDGNIKFDRLSAAFKDGTWCFVEGSRNTTRNKFATLLRQKELNIQFERHRPGGMTFCFKKNSSLFGLPLLKLKKVKGCHIGKCSVL